MTVTSVMVGAVTESSARVVTQVSSTSNVRVKVSTDAAMTGAVFYGPVVPSASPQFMASVTLTGLVADTRYYYQVEHAGVVNTTLSGQFRTHPPVGTAADFSFLLATCAGSHPESPPVSAGTLAAAQTPSITDDILSNHEVFEDIQIRALAEESLFFAHAGDMHYYNLGSGNYGIPTTGNTVANYRWAYEDVLKQDRQHSLYRNVPLVYSWDDHDFGPNDSDGTSTGKEEVAQVYREKFPHYPLGSATGPIYHSFEIGRVLFVVLDVRYNRSANSAVDDSSKSMIGATQKSWFTSQVVGSTASALVVISGSQWNGTSTDSWGAFTTERAELISIMQSAGYGPDNTLILFGDSHQSGITSGAGNPYGGFALGMFAPLDCRTNAPHEASRWDAGQMVAVRGCYGLIKVRDTGTDIVFSMTGFSEDQPKIWHSFSTGGKTTVHAGNPSHVVAL